MQERRGSETAAPNTYACGAIVPHMQALVKTTTTVRTYSYSYSCSIILGGNCKDRSGIHSKTFTAGLIVCAGSYSVHHAAVRFGDGWYKQEGITNRVAVLYRTAVLLQ